VLAAISLRRQFLQGDMTSFLAMLFTLRIGLGASPMDGVKVSLREEALAVAVQAAQVERPPAATPYAVVRAGDPPQRQPLTRDDWLDLLTGALSNETLANAAMWVADQPVSVSVSREKLFVSVRIATP
jgi:hypothetical protein